MDYEVKLEIFEGPLDLLLHLIHKNEVDIFDIPIATITDQYLEYLDVMKALNINVAGDFLVMASTLIHIKSKMLLPELQDDEEEDPREEITRPLLEYMRFKEIAGELSERDVLDRDVFARKMSDYLQSQIEHEEPLMDVSLFQLMDAFKRIVDQRLPGVQLKLKIAKWSVKEKTEVIISVLRNL
jgi:segregation and condensation protein A